MVEVESLKEVLQRSKILLIATVWNLFREIGKKSEH